MSAQVEPGGTVTLRFANTGRQGAVLHVYDRRHLDRIPRCYTVEAGKTLEDSAWDAAKDSGVYDLDVYSTNGFFRSFTGSTQANGAAALELQVDYDVSGSALRAQIHNAGAAPVEVRIDTNAYRTDGPWTLSLAPNETAQRFWTLFDSGNWYDFTISAAGFERRFAGRMENGGNLISDPAMAT